jgi:putative transcriptional regulator
MTPDLRATDLLIAPPGFPDQRFRNTVLMLTHDHHAGSFALCVNKTTRWCLDEVIEASDISLDHVPNIPVYWGGPVSANSLWMIHSAEWKTQHTVRLDAEWAMTSDVEMFQHLADRDYPNYFRIVMGYCSWAPGQLRAELEGQPPRRKQHAWLLARNLGAEWLFEQPLEDVWANATTVSGHQAIDSWL